MNPKKKGNRGEWKFAHWLRDKRVCKAMRNPSSGSNIIKSDVANEIGINFEVKTVKRLNLKEVMKQTERDAFKSHTIPYAVIHLDGMPDDTWYMVMNNHDWLNLWNKAQTPKIVEKSQNQHAKYITQNAINSLKKLLKYLEGRI